MMMGNSQHLRTGEAQRSVRLWGSVQAQAADFQAPQGHWVALKLSKEQSLAAARVISFKRQVQVLHHTLGLVKVLSTWALSGLSI